MTAPSAGGQADWLVELLARTATFASASADHLRAIAGFGCELEVDPGRWLAREGVALDDMILVLDGRAVQTSADGETSELGPGEVVGEATVLDGTPQHVTVEALTPMRLFVVPLRRLADPLTNRP